MSDLDQFDDDLEEEESDEAMRALEEEHIRHYTCMFQIISEGVQILNGTNREYPEGQKEDLLTRLNRVFERIMRAFDETPQNAGFCFTDILMDDETLQILREIQTFADRYCYKEIEGRAASLLEIYGNLINSAAAVRGHLTRSFAATETLARATDAQAQRDLEMIRKNHGLVKAIFQLLWETRNGASTDGITATQELLGQIAHCYFDDDIWTIFNFAEAAPADHENLVQMMSRTLFKIVIQHKGAFEPSPESGDSETMHLAIHTALFVTLKTLNLMSNELIDQANASWGQPTDTTTA